VVLLVKAMPLNCAVSLAAHKWLQSTIVDYLALMIELLKMNVMMTMISAAMD
jgi:hypothetical protein